MNLNTRLSRIESTMNPSGDPYANLTDDELGAALVAVKDTLKAAAVMSEREYSQHLQQRLAEGKLSEDLEPGLFRRYVEALFREVALRGRRIFDKPEVALQ